MADLTDVVDSWNELFDHIENGSDDTFDGEEDTLRRRALQNASLFFNTNGEPNEAMVEWARGMWDNHAEIKGDHVYLSMPSHLDSDGNVVEEKVQLPKPPGPDDYLEEDDD